MLYTSVKLAFFTVNDNCEELTKELIPYKLYNNGQTPVLPKYDLTICKKNNA